MNLSEFFQLAKSFLYRTRWMRHLLWLLLGWFMAGTFASSLVGMQEEQRCILSSCYRARAMLAIMPPVAWKWVFIAAWASVPISAEINIYKRKRRVFDIK